MTDRRNDAHPHSMTEVATAVTHWAEDAWHRLDLRRLGVFLALRARQGARRARGSLIPVLVAGAAALIAFVIAHSVLGHPTPFFAPIVAWICLGFTYNRIPRKVAEIGAGAAIGVGVGEVVYLSFGTGPLPIAIGLIVAGLLGRFFDRGDLFTIQSGVNAMVVIGFGDMAGASGGPFARWSDALVGCAVGLLFAMAFPGDVLARPRRQLRGLLSELATALTMLSGGLRTGNAEELRDAFIQCKGVHITLEDARTALTSSVDIVALNPALRRLRVQVAELDRQLALCTRLINTIEMLLRQTRGTVDEAGASHQVARLIDRSVAILLALSAAIGNWQQPEFARAQAVELAAACAPEQFVKQGWRGMVLVSLMRSVVIDLLQLTGLSRTQAREYLPDTGIDAPDPANDTLAEDEPSQLWGR